MKGAFPLLVLFAFAGCRDEDIVRVRVPKEEPTVETAAEAAPRGLRWRRPEGWKELPASGMRLATLRPPGSGKAEATVIALPGEVGGELANVNRWRGQIGLSAFDEKALAAARATVNSKAGPVRVYDFTSADGKARVVAGTIAIEGATWFVKLSGDSAPVAVARPAFMRLLGSLHVSR